MKEETLTCGPLMKSSDLGLAVQNEKYAAMITKKIAVLRSLETYLYIM
jgi:hypothetical protein